MSELRSADPDDTAGHGGRLPDDPARDEADDVEGHGFRPAGIDAFDEADDDVAGHLSPRPSGAHDPVTDDVEGRRFPGGLNGSSGDTDPDDDVSGHGLGPVDPKQA